MTQIFLMFFQSILPTFTNFNKFLQTEEPLIQCLYDEVQQFMNKLASKFVKPEVIQNLKAEELLFAKLNIYLQNQKDDASLTIGFLTKTTIRKALDDGSIDEDEADRFYDAVRSFYETAYDYCVKWLPFDDPLYKVSKFIEFSNRASSTFDELTDLVTKFPSRFNLISDPVQLDLLEEEVQLYQSLSETEVPRNVWEESVVRTRGERSYHRMDMVWNHLWKSLPKLSRIALFLLTIPHSNAAEERIFSMIGKNTTKFRSSLDHSALLNSIMLIKMNRPEHLQPCYR